MSSAPEAPEKFSSTGFTLFRDVMTCSGSSNLVLEQFLAGSGTESKDLGGWGGGVIHWDIVMRKTTIMQEMGERTTFLGASVHEMKLENLLQCAKHEANES